MTGDYKSGLVLEGGGNRGIYTSGVLDAFIEKGITFPYVIGVSAGSCNAASYIGKNYRRQHDITINYCNDKRYMSVNSIFKNGQYLNLEWDFGELTYNIMPLDYETYESSGTQLCAVTDKREDRQAGIFLSQRSARIRLSRSESKLRAADRYKRCGHRRRSLL